MARDELTRRKERNGLRSPGVEDGAGAAFFREGLTGGGERGHQNKKKVLSSPTAAGVEPRARSPRLKKKKMRFTFTSSYQKKVFNY